MENVETGDEIKLCSRSSPQPTDEQKLLIKLSTMILGQSTCALNFILSVPII